MGSILNANFETIHSPYGIFLLKAFYYLNMNQDESRREMRYMSRHMRLPVVQCTVFNDLFCYIFPDKEVV